METAAEAGYPLPVSEHEKPGTLPDVQASAAVSHDPSWSLVALIVLIELLWFSAIGYFVYRLLS